MKGRSLIQLGSGFEEEKLVLAPGFDHGEHTISGCEEVLKSCVGTQTRSQGKRMSHSRVAVTPGDRRPATDSLVALSPSRASWMRLSLKPAESPQWGGRRELSTLVHDRPRCPVASQWPDEAAQGARGVVRPCCLGPCQVPGAM